MSSTKSKAAAESAAASAEHATDRTAETVKDATNRTASTMNEATDKAAGVAIQGFDKTLATMKEGMDKASRGLETSQLKIKEGVDKALKTAEEMISFTQGNIEAIMKSSQIYASGFQNISKNFAASNQLALEDSVSFTKSLMSVKSVKEAVDLQSEFARSTIEKLVTETNKMTDASVKLAEEAMAPLTTRMSVAVQTFGKVN